MAEKKRAGMLALVAIMLTNFAYMADMAIVPAADGIFMAFPDAPEWLLNFVLTGPQVIGLFSAILMGSLMQRVSKRTLILVLFGIFTVSSCAGALVHNAWYIAFMRALTGFGAGGIASVALALIRDLYGADEQQVEAYTSGFSAVTAAIGAVMSIVAGILAVGGWSRVYLVYLAAIPLFILMWVAIPATEVDGEKKVASGAGVEPIPWGRVAAMLCSLMVVCITCMLMSYESAIYVAETGLGDSGLAGIYSAVLTVATCVACILFPAMYGKLGRKVAALMYALLAIGFAGLYLLPNAIVSGLCIVALGYAYGIAMSYFFIYPGSFVPGEHMDRVISIVSAAIGFGTFLCSFVASGVQAALGSGVAGVCGVYAALLAVGAVASLALAKRGGC